MSPPELVDVHGQPLRKPVLRRSLTEADGRGLRTIQTTLHHAGVTPDRLASILREAEDGDPRTYLELAELIEERDLHYLAVLGVRRRQVSQLPIRVVPADESPEAEADAELLREWLKARELEDEVFDMLDAIGKGFSVAEIVWETSAREWMPARLEHRLPQWFRFDQVSGSRLQRLEDGGQWVDLEPGKFVCHFHRAKSGLAIRGGLARMVAWAWAFKAFGIRDWLRFIERYGHPMPIGKYHPNATPEEIDTLWRAVRGIGAEGAAVMHESMEIDYVENTGTGVRADLYKDLLTQFDAYISKCVLGQTLTTQEGDSGSYSLGQVHDEVRADIERSDARQVAASLTNQLGRPMVLLNRGDPGPRGFPRFVIGKEEEIDPAVLADVMSKLPDFEVRDEQARRIFGLEEPQEGDKVVTGGGGRPGETAAEARAIGLEAIRAARTGDARGLRDLLDGLRSKRLEERLSRRPLRLAALTAGDVDAIDRAVADLVGGDGWRPIMDPVFGPIFEAVSAAAERGESLEDFRERLPSLFAEMDDTRLVEALRNLGFTASLSGQLGLGSGRDDLDGGGDDG